jgi:hypothetical protein
LRFRKDSKNLIMVPDSSPPSEVKNIKDSESFLNCGTRSLPEKVQSLKRDNGLWYWEIWNEQVRLWTGM